MNLNDFQKYLDGVGEKLDHERAEKLLDIVGELEAKLGDFLVTVVTGPEDLNTFLTLTLVTWGMLAERTISKFERQDRVKVFQAFVKSLSCLLKIPARGSKRRKG